MQKALVILLIIIAVSVKGQDYKNSHFFYQPNVMNPALTGVSKGPWRAGMNYKSQWASIAKGFKSQNFFIQKKAQLDKTKHNYIGLGFNTTNNVEGAINMHYTTLGLSASIIKSLTSESHVVHYISAGINSNFSAQGYNLENAQFSSQFNGTTFDQNLTSGEETLLQNINYMTHHAGFFWFLSPTEGFNIYTGASLFHFNNPNISFIQDGKNELPTTIKFHGGVDLLKYTKKDQVASSFNLLYFYQNNQQESQFTMALIANHRTNQKSSTLVGGGVVYRHGDALALLVKADIETELGNFGLAYSYDINSSSIVNTTAAGGSELTLYFNAMNLIKFKKPFVVPEY